MSALLMSALLMSALLANMSYFTPIYGDVLSRSTWLKIRLSLATVNFTHLKL